MTETHKQRLFVKKEAAAFKKVFRTTKRICLALTSDGLGAKVRKYAEDNGYRVSVSSIIRCIAKSMNHADEIIKGGQVYEKRETLEGHNVAINN
jgi:hypothetical protein